MMETLIDRLQKLLSVKSLVTLSLTGVFCALCIRGVVSPDQFMTIFTVVISFYFGTQAERKSILTAAEPTNQEAKATITEGAE